MKIIRQIVIIWAVTLAGELLSALVPLPIPAGVYGLVLMLVLLLTGALKLEQVEQTGYGIVMPEMEEMTLEEPEIIRQSGRYGVRLSHFGF